jgi:basic amino acid/polyamine antiporter, APA family
MKIRELFRRKTFPSGEVQADSTLNEPVLVRNLNLKDLTFMGIAAIIGAGIFSTIGNASFHGGPAVSMLFVFTAIACTFSALCYAQFASSVPLSGSAYTYAYVSFGEIIAWIIGWTLIVEYAIGNIAVAISWSDYFTGLLHGMTGLEIPPWLAMDYLSASRGFEEVTGLLASGSSITELPVWQQEAWRAWTDAPEISGIRCILDIPALAIVFLITALVYRGIHESKRAANLFVYLKLGVILLVILAGAFYVDPGNWSPFAPNGIKGVLQGVSSVFFAYIGFDALSTTAEECKDPKKDLPRSMILSLVICTVLYILITLVLTGMVNYTELALGDPLSYVFERVGLHWISGVVGASAVVAIASVLLVFQLGQPRIWMSMSRDGLLPKRFSRLHPRFRTPAFSTIVTGILVAVPALFMNLKEVTDLSSIGTLFAFVVVCAGVLRMDPIEIHKNKGFRVPYVNGKWILPGLFALTVILITNAYPDWLVNYFSFGNDTAESFSHKIPSLSFILLSVFMVFETFRKNLSLIPVLGLLTNFYLMTELGISNWTFFFLWLMAGLVVYFIYGVRHSKLNSAKRNKI